MLLFLILFLLLFLLFMISLSFLFTNNLYVIRKFLLVGLVFCFFLSLGLLIFFDRSNTGYQFLTLHFFGIKDSFFYSCYFAFGVDGISLFFILLTTFLTPLCILLC